MCALYCDCHCDSEAADLLSHRLLNNVLYKMGQTLCICSRGTITIDNKKYYYVQKLDEG